METFFCQLLPVCFSMVDHLPPALPLSPTYPPPSRPWTFSLVLLPAVLFAGVQINVWSS